jgi:hypothetical protein
LVTEGEDLKVVTRNDVRAARAGSRLLVVITDSLIEREGESVGVESIAAI